MKDIENISVFTLH